MYSYIAPTVTDVTGLSASAVPVAVKSTSAAPMATFAKTIERSTDPVYLLAFGVGGLVGTTLGGIGAYWPAQPVAAWLTVLLVSTVGSMLAVTLQMRLMEVAGDARTIGAALNHASLNLANALGAWLGGVVIAAGLGYTAPSWAGAGLSLAGLVVLAVSVAVHRRDTRPAQAPEPSYSSTSRS